MFWSAAKEKLIFTTPLCKYYKAKSENSWKFVLLCCDCVNYTWPMFLSGNGGVYVSHNQA